MSKEKIIVVSAGGIDAIKPEILKQLNEKFGVEGFLVVDPKNLKQHITETKAPSFERNIPIINTHELLHEAELKKLTKLEELRRNEAQKKKQSAIGQAVINTAVAVTSALTTQPFLPLAPILAALAAASGAVQIGIISSQQFAKGGFTGDGSGRRDETGHIPVGIVHDNEFVLDKSYTTQNRKELEYIHKNRINIADLMTMPNLTMNPILSNYHVNELGELKKEMKEVKEAIQHGFKHMPQAEMHADIRGLSIVTRKTNEREKHWRR